MNQYIKTLEICRVTPFTDSNVSVAESSLPLTHFDTMWIKFFSITQRVFFYQLGEHESTHAFFNSVLIPKLKHSLSLTLTHFLPVAGNIVWPIDAMKPSLLYCPNDGVSFTVAESNSNFSHFIHNMCDAADVHPYVPELPTSESKASLISFQITLFPSQGFALGISMHHVMFDGKSIALFMKSWAYICKENWKQAILLPPELTPVFDRTVVHDPHGLDLLNLNNWCLISNPNSKSLETPHIIRNSKDLVRATFYLPHQDIDKLKQRIIASQLRNEYSKNIHLSTFVVSYAYCIVSIVKAKNLDIRGKVGVRFAMDCRSRMNPPLPDNYFGSCIKASSSIFDTKTIVEKNGIASIAIELSNKIEETDARLKNPTIKQEHEEILRYKNIAKVVDMMIGVSGSPRFGIYSTDFGWGKPKLTQVVTTDKNGSISMAEGKDGNKSIEIGLVLKKHEMEIFNSCFINGLKDM